MEILRKGTLPSEKTYTATCLRCDTQFRFTRGEARYQSDQRSPADVVIPCPVCHAEVWTKA